MHFQVKQEEMAKTYLELPESYPALKPLDKARIVFRIWRYPSFTSSSSWLLYKIDDSFFVRRIEWDFVKDYLYYLPSEPTIYGSEAEISKEQTEAIIEKLQSLKITAFQTSDLFGCDGTTYGVDIKFEQLHPWQVSTKNYPMRFSWWSRPPEGWQPLADWLEETAIFFDSLLPASTAKMTDELVKK
jgi:hypothetical protein